MDDNSSELMNLINRTYVYVMRDLAYVLGGSLVLATIQYATHGGSIASLKEIIDYISDGIVRFLIFIGGAYFIGFFVEEGWSFFCSKFVNTETTTPDGESRLLVMARIHSEFGIDTIMRIERIVFLKHMGATCASASATSSIISLVPMIISVITCSKYGVTILVSILLMLLTFIGFLEGRRQRKGQAKALKDLTDYINQKKQILKL